MSELKLLQAMRLKGQLAADAAPTFAGEHSSDVLDGLAAAGLIKVGTVGTRLTPAGIDQLDSLLTAERETLDREPIAALYEEFDAPNTELKTIISAWQTRPDGSPNDHTDAGYDTDVINELLAESVAAVSLAERIAAIVPRLDTYPARLRTALERIATGDHKHVANPMVDSYHQIWFELHEELIGLLGLNRVHEASEGRA